MTSAGPAHTDMHSSRHMMEHLSTALAILLTLVGAFFFFKMPGWQPDPGSQFWVYALPWAVLGYLAVQLIALLSSAIDTRSIGFIDSVTALFPALVGAIAGVETLQGVIQLSGFQRHALLLMIGTSVLEALVTLWVRFTVNKRTIGFDTGS